MRSVFFWIVFHIPLGPLAPWIMGLALGSRPQRAPTIAEMWPEAERLGLALIPQSDGDGFRWLACDIERIHYGAAIIIYPLEYRAYSVETAAEAIRQVAEASK